MTLESQFHVREQNQFKKLNYVILTLVKNFKKERKAWLPSLVYSSKKAT